MAGHEDFTYAKNASNFWGADVWEPKQTNKKQVEQEEFPGPDGVAELLRTQAVVTNRQNRAAFNLLF